MSSSGCYHQPELDETEPTTDAENIAVSLQSDVGMCRICHEGAGEETLLSPCDCTGTLGKVHKSCLETWLSASNTSSCELCRTEFNIERRPKPLTQWLKDPGSRCQRLTLLCDMSCFLVIELLLATSVWLFLGDHLQLFSRANTNCLFTVVFTHLTIDMLRMLVKFQQHWQLYLEWRRNNQEVRLLIPDSNGGNTTQSSVDQEND